MAASETREQEARLEIERVTRQGEHATRENESLKGENRLLRNEIWRMEREVAGLDRLRHEQDAFRAQSVMLQSIILPKGFQRIGYHGLQATKAFKKWVDVIKEGLRRAGRVIKGIYEVVASKKYRERYQEMSGRDPLICRFRGREMDLWAVWHPS